MKYSLVNGERQEAQPKLGGTCPACGNATLAKCGKINAWHWAHRGKRICDPWWENETEWHRSWKNRFPVDWQEVVHYSDDGEKHIADVKTGDGWAIEFQHSRISPEERLSREVFYKKLVWVVDGARVKRDLKQFSASWEGGVPLGNGPRKRICSEPCSILKEWSDSTALVFLDFGHIDFIFWIHSKGTSGTIKAEAFSRTDFVDIHCSRSRKAKNFDALARTIGKSPGTDRPHIPDSPTRHHRQRLIPRHMFQGRF